MTCPTVPSSFGSKTISFSSPSWLALPATFVPLTPMVKTGVVTCMASLPVLAICPDMKEKFPVIILAFMDPVVGSAGSYTKSSMTILAPGSTDIELSSLNATPTLPSLASITSLRYIRSPFCNSMNWSARCTMTGKSAVVILPMALGSSKATLDVSG